MRAGSFDGHNGVVWTCDITCEPLSRFCVLLRSLNRLSRSYSIQFATNACDKPGRVVTALPPAGPHAMCWLAVLAIEGCLHEQIMHPSRRCLQTTPRCCCRLPATRQRGYGPWRRARSCSATASTSQPAPASAWNSAGLAGWERCWLGSDIGECCGSGCRTAAIAYCCRAGQCCGWRGTCHAVCLAAVGALVARAQHALTSLCCRRHPCLVPAAGSAWASGRQPSPQTPS